MLRIVDQLQSIPKIFLNNSKNWCTVNDYEFLIKNPKVLLNVENTTFMSKSSFSNKKNQ